MSEANKQPDEKWAGIIYQLRQGGMGFLALVALVVMSAWQATVIQSFLKEIVDQGGSNNVTVQKWLEIQERDLAQQEEQLRVFRDLRDSVRFLSSRSVPSVDPDQK